MTSEAAPSAPVRRDWWTPEQLGERWQVTEEHVRTLIRTGTLRAKDFATGRVPRYRVSDSERRRFETAPKEAS